VGIMSQLSNFLQSHRRPQKERKKPLPQTLEPVPASGARGVSRTRASEEATAGPSRLSRWMECIQRLLATDGYVIQPSSEEMETGSSVRIWGSDQAFEITGAATYEDALRQWRVYQKISGEEEMEAPPPASAHWYKFGAKVAPLS
jgi:hypothetical protein